MYHDSGNAIHFSIFTIQIFLSCQRIMIPKYNTVSYSQIEKQNFISANVQNNFNMHAGVYSSINWPLSTRGQNSILNGVLILKPKK